VISTGGPVLPSARGRVAMFPIEQAESLSPCTVRWRAATPLVHEPVRLLLRAVPSFRSIPDRSNHPSMERSSISTTPAIVSRMTRDLVGLLRLLRKQDTTRARSSPRPVTASPAPVVSTNRPVRHDECHEHDAILRRTNADSPPSDSWYCLATIPAFARPRGRPGRNHSELSLRRRSRGTASGERSLRPSHLPAVWASGRALQVSEPRFAGPQGRTLTLWKMATRRRSPGSRERP